MTMKSDELKNISSSQEIVMDGKAIFKRVFSYIWRYQWWLILSLICLVILAATQVGIAAILEPIVNEGVVKQNAFAAKWLPILIFVLMVLRSIFGFGSSYLMAKIGRSTIRDMRQEFFEKMTFLSASYYDNVPSSTLVSKFIFDIEQTAVMMTETLASMIRNALTAIGLIAWMIYLDWRLCLIAVFSVPLVAYVTHYSNKKFRNASDQIQNSMGDIAETIKENALGQKIIKIYGAQKAQIDNFTLVNKDNFIKNMRRARVSAAIVPVTTLCIAPVFAIILYVYLNYLVEGTDAAGRFVSFLGALVMLMSPLKNLVKVNEKLQVGITAANSIFQVIDLEKEEDKGEIAISSSNGIIQFENVNFHYQGEMKEVISEVNLEINSGEKVALVGSSGSGKSTLASLLMRFYTPSQGKILLDGVDIKNYRLSDYRSLFSLVNQDPLLFDNTIRHNITYGAQSINEEKLQRAVEAAYVSEFLDEMPDGLDTQIGEHGSRLSGGQKQRISIARAFYKNAPILILDEATSALDVKSERYIQEALNVLMQNRTSIVIAHRLSTIENADKIFVLKDGSLVESGNHGELLKKQGVYSDFHNTNNVDAVDSDIK